MKKIFILILAFLSLASYGQAEYEKIKITENSSSTTATKINVQEADGEINYMSPENIPLNLTPHPLNYDITAPTLSANLIGIDTRLGQIVQTTAGVTNRIYFTGVPVTIGAGTFYTSSATGKGAVTGVTQTVSNGDNIKSYFAQDVISIAQPALMTAPAGNFAGQLSVMVSDDSAQERYTIEVYKCNNAGTPIPSGITGAPTGNLGVTVVAILDSGILDLVQNAVTNIGVSGLLNSTLTLNTGERLRYHVSSEKIGTAGASFTFSLFYGSNYNSYYDVPVTPTTDTVLNRSTVAGTTSSDALNNLNTGKANDSNTVHKTGDTFTESLGFPPLLSYNTDTSIGKRTLQPEMTKLSTAYTTILSWGDSLTAGAGSTPGFSYPSYLSTLTAYTITNKGVGGETSTQIKDRLVADTGNYDKTVIIWAGRNNYGSPTTVKADIATMISTLGHDRYLVLGILNGDYSSEWNTGVNYPVITQLNQDLKALYGEKYVPIREYLVSLHNNSAQDLIDFGLDIVPLSLRSDNIHLNDAGYVKVAEFVFQKLGIALGQEGYLQSKDFKGLFEDLNPLHKFGDETFTGVKTSTNTTTTLTNGFNLTNSGNGLTSYSIGLTVSGSGSGIYGAATSTGNVLYGEVSGSTAYGARFNNGGSGGVRIDNVTGATQGILINTLGTIRGINITNTGTGASNFTNVSGGGQGFYANTTAGTGLLVGTSSAALGALFDSSSSAAIVRLNSQTGATGNILELRKNNVNAVIYNSNAVRVVVNSPTTSAGGYEIFTRNTSTGFEEKIPSTTFAPNVLTGFTAGAGTITGTDTVLQGIQKNAGNVALKAPLASPAFTGNGSIDNNWSIGGTLSMPAGNVAFTGNSLGFGSMPQLGRVSDHFAFSGSILNSFYIEASTDNLTAVRTRSIANVSGEETVSLSGSATLDFPSTGAGLSSELTITVTGAVDGDVVSLGVPNASSLANTCYTARVSAANIVTVKFNNYSILPADPASGSFKAKVLK